MRDYSPTLIDVVPAAISQQPQIKILDRIGSVRVRLCRSRAVPAGDIIRAAAAGEKNTHVTRAVPQKEGPKKGLDIGGEGKRARESAQERLTKLFC